MIFMRFTVHLQESVAHSFLLMNDIPFHGYTAYYFSIHQLMNICVVSSSGLSMNSDVMNICIKSLCLHNGFDGSQSSNPIYK